MEVWRWTNGAALGIDPQAYLRDALDRISTHPAKWIDELLPDRWQELRQAGGAGTDRPALSPGFVITPDEPPSVESRCGMARRKRLDPDRGAYGCNGSMHLLQLSLKCVLSGNALRR